MSNYDEHGTADHYDAHRINMTHMLEAIWGTEALMMFHEINAFKYRTRAGKKDDAMQDIKKAQWSEKMAEFLREKKDKEPGIGKGRHPLYPDFIKLLEDD